MENRPKHLTFDERKLIEIYCKQGLSCCEIGRRIGRSKNGVVTEVRVNGGREKYTAEKAQKFSDQKNETKKRKLCDINQQNSPTRFMKQRINNLEMQVEILLDTIRGLKDVKH